MNKIKITENDLENIMNRKTVDKYSDEIWNHIDKKGFLLKDFTLVLENPYRCWKIHNYKVGTLNFFHIKVIVERPDKTRFSYERDTSVGIHKNKLNEMINDIISVRNKEELYQAIDSKGYVDDIVPMSFMAYCILQAMNREYKECGITNIQYKPAKERKNYNNKKEYKMFDIIRKYEKHINKNRHFISCEKWDVKGHFRHYKSGKVVYIEPYEKGKGRKKDKEYIL